MFPLPLPWLIVGVLVSLFGTYRVGHHYGWLERDGDMKIAIAKKNDEARLIEQNMGEKLNQQSLKLQEANDAVNKKTTALAVANRAGKLRLCPTSNLQTPTEIVSSGASGICFLKRSVMCLIKSRSVIKNCGEDSFEDSIIVLS